MHHWLSCPHCKTYFESPRESQPVRNCPTCGKALAAGPKPVPGKSPAKPALSNSPAVAAKPAPVPLPARSSKPAAAPLSGKLQEAKPAPSPVSPCGAASLFGSRHAVLAEGQVVPDAGRCVQCGICSYNCPIAIDVRAHAWRGLPVNSSYCLTCGECVKRCPRGVLTFERIPLPVKAER